jgi:hypothetical protein
LSKKDILIALNEKLASYSKVNNNSNDNNSNHAKKTFDMIETHGIIPDLYSYNCLLKAFANCNNDDDNIRITALQYFNKMLERNIKPNYITYSALIDITLKFKNTNESKDNSHNINEAIEYFKLCEKTGKYLEKQSFDLLFDKLLVCDYYCYYYYYYYIYYYYYSYDYYDAYYDSYYDSYYDFYYDFYND